MPRVLTEGVTITCGHELPPVYPGKVKTEGVKKLTVKQSPVLVAAGVDGKGVQGCGTQPSNTTSACTKVLKVTAGQATKLTVDKAGVLLDSRLAGTTVGKPPGTLTVSPGGPDKLVAT